jgi:large subunit ribosomal protein L10
LAITKEKKVKMVAGYLDTLSRSGALLFADYRGLTVAQMTDLRRRLREVESGFLVVKNTLLTMALKQSGIPVPAEELKGPVGIAYCLGEPTPVAQLLRDFAKENDSLRIKGGILGTLILDAAGVQALADLPPREVILAQVLGAVQAPMSSLVSTLNAPMRDLVQVLQARSEQDQKAAA